MAKEELEDFVNMGGESDMVDEGERVSITENRDKQHTDTDGGPRDSAAAEEEALASLRGELAAMTAERDAAKAESNELRAGAAEAASAAAAAAAGASSSDKDEGKSGASPREVMQSVFETLAEVLEREAQQREGASYTQAEVMKRVKAVLKKVSQAYA